MEKIINIVLSYTAELIKHRCRNRTTCIIQEDYPLSLHEMDEADAPLVAMSVSKQFRKGAQENVVKPYRIIDGEYYTVLQSNCFFTDDVAKIFYQNNYINTVISDKDITNIAHNTLNSELRQNNITETFFDPSKHEDERMQQRIYLQSLFNMGNRTGPDIKEFIIDDNPPVKSWISDNKKETIQKIQKTYGKMFLINGNIYHKAQLPIITVSKISDESYRSEMRIENHNAFVDNAFEFPLCFMDAAVQFEEDIFSHAERFELSNDEPSFCTGQYLIVNNELAWNQDDVKNIMGQIYDELSCILTSLPTCLQEKLDTWLDNGNLYGLDDILDEYSILVSQTDDTKQKISLDKALSNTQCFYKSIMDMIYKLENKQDVCNYIHNGEMSHKDIAIENLTKPHLV